MIFNIDSLCRIDVLKEHDEIRQHLLDLISKTPSDVLTEQTTELVTDFHISNSGTARREWVDYLLHYLDPHLKETVRLFGYESYILQNIWFQQYTQGQNHGWHTHGGNYTNVYYLEFDEGAPKTQMREMGKTIEKDFDVKESCVLSFPSYIWHTAPKVQNDKRKTIISWNMNLV